MAQGFLLCGNNKGDFAAYRNAIILLRYITWYCVVFVLHPAPNSFSLTAGCTLPVKHARCTRRTFVIPSGPRAREISPPVILLLSPPGEAARGEESLRTFGVNYKTSKTKTDVAARAAGKECGNPTIRQGFAFRRRRGCWTRPSLRVGRSVNKQRAGQGPASRRPYAALH